MYEAILPVQVGQGVFFRNWVRGRGVNDLVDVNGDGSRLRHFCSLICQFYSMYRGEKKLYEVSKKKKKTKR